jgi:hypothetical protein
MSPSGIAPMSAAFDLTDALARARREPPFTLRTVAPGEWSLCADLAPMLEFREECRRADPRPAPRFVRLPYIEPRTITARPRGAHDAPEWTRHAGALLRLANGRGSLLDVRAAMAHERKALEYAPSPWPSPPSKRYRAEREKCEPTPPTFTADELKHASAMIDAKCAGPLAECAWCELRNPPRKCKPADSLEVRVRRAIWRAERTMRDDGCRRARRGLEAPIALGGRAPRDTPENYFRSVRGHLVRI